MKVFTFYFIKIYTAHSTVGGLMKTNIKSLFCLLPKNNRQRELQIKYAYPKSVCPIPHILSCWSDHIH